LGVYNNLANNVAYTLRAVLQTNRLLLSAQPLVYTLSPLAPPRGQLLQWNSIEGEYYFVEHKATLTQAQWDIIATVRATTPLTTYEVFDPGFYRVTQVSPLIIPTPKLFIQLWTNNQVRLYWSTNSPGFTLQFALSPLGPWTDLSLPVNTEGPDFAVYDVIGPLPRYYRLRP